MRSGVTASRIAFEVGGVMGGENCLSCFVARGYMGLRVFGKCLGRVILSEVVGGAGVRCDFERKRWGRHGVYKRGAGRWLTLG